MGVGVWGAGASQDSFHFIRIPALDLVPSPAPDPLATLTFPPVASERLHVAWKPRGWISTFHSHYLISFPGFR